MKPTLHRLISLLALLLVMLFSTNVLYAQRITEENMMNSDDEVKSLGEILNPTPKDHNANLPANDRANIYFDRCLATESLAFDKDEKEILCACTSAKIGEILSGKEFLQLYKDTRQGANARMKVITYAYTDCVDYALRSKVYKDCRVLPLLKNVIRGRDQICECAAKEYEKLVHRAMAHIIMEGVKYQPMTLNPLEQHFTNDSYYTTIENYGNVCHARMVYNKHN